MKDKITMIENMTRTSASFKNAKDFQLGQSREPENSKGQNQIDADRDFLQRIFADFKSCQIRAAPGRNRKSASFLAAASSPTDRRRCEIGYQQKNRQTT